MMVRSTNFEKYNTTEVEIRKYFEQNYDHLDPIEGIWTVNHPAMVNAAKVAIVKDSSSYDRDFFEVILSSNSGWIPNIITAHFSSLAYENTYVSKQFGPDGSSTMYNLYISNDGVLKTSNNDIYYLKVFPKENYKSKNTESDFNSSKSVGTGFIISETGLVATNYHVVDKANEIDIALPSSNKVLRASIQVKDVKNDLCILKIENFNFYDYFSKKIPFKINNSENIKIGQDVFTLGYPLGQIMGTKSRLSSGKINSLFGIQDDPRLFQISNPLQPGNSGGPLFDSNGQIIGIVVSSLNAKFFYENLGIIPQNVNFAIKASYLDNLIKMIPIYSGTNDSQRLKNLKLEYQIELINPYIVQVIAN
jgi:serine protease Do